MTRRLRIRAIDAMAVIAIAAYSGYRAQSRPPRGEGPSTFAQSVDLDPLYRTAVQADGRLRSFESHAKTYVGGYVTGPRGVNGQTHGFTYLDLMFRSEAYAATDLIYVKNKEVRKQILDALVHHPALSEERRESIMKSGQFARSMLMEPPVMRLLQELGEDLIRTSKVVNAIQSALTASDSGFLGEHLRLVAPPGGERDRLWVSLSQLAGRGGAPQDAVHAGLASTLNPLPGLDTQLQARLVDTWNALRTAWRSEDVAAVNQQIAALSALLPSVSPALYPTPGRLAMESWYFRSNSMTWVWLLYLASVVPLLMAVIYHWDGARKTGLVLFVVAFAAQTISVAVRWYISGRWPNANMFEAVTTSAWFGGVGALILERVARRSPLKNLFALGSAVVSMAALMAAYFLPAQLDSGINNKMAALNDVWLYIHTNVIIWSYAVIGLACVPALLLLRDRWCKMWDSRAMPRVRLLLLPIALAVFNYTGYVLFMRAISPETAGYSERQMQGIAGACIASLFMLILEGLAARERSRSGQAVRERSSSGGTAALMGSAAGFLREGKPSRSQVYDGATMVLVELSFIMLWAGLVMGAIWADHSWGRPWGWDPKEVFALNTFLIFLVLIHVRLKVRDKAFWTAILAVFGFEVMMFNWIVVNFVISGLHSYA
jgi:ABC-type transport system involved in cytochrome c biogenesis permease subunit